ncbi:hypothetical protein G6F57_004834 [Rhizopus arrhizus]|uniref:PIN domain-containing protein n=1 Tax=Rhizopus oryzae TaxID=64495 RepID=A0A9P6XJQ9_RHIOR|nr:hypothetical protein G6F23_008283 [Rhizopus arrhizus]KAG1424485.1 hypothetical protein G6F58_002342 [Rhizopus delemar]KAG0760913.1 hypothetical protein G6F24_007954 [Rhizopus arrhizus]KAG0795313.1 hypothetical protein G6F21_002203 [Rhizopus arrhizus]KAG0799748.1 hypothetical protein G6F22_002917 [Rhizopus arrhizus]
MADTIDIMDIDGPEFINEVNAQIESIRSHHQDVTLDVSLFNTNYKDVHSFSQIAVVDTNFLISNLGSLQALLKIAEENPGNLLILIPWVVIRELDGLKGFLKSSTGKKDLPILSRKAMKFIEDQLRNKTKSLRGQKLHETMNSKSMQGMDIDDEYIVIHEDHDMLIDDDDGPLAQHFQSGAINSKWAKESPPLKAPRRPTPPPIEISPPLIKSDRSTWASIHASKYY